MKKVIIVVLVAVFAISFATAITSAKGPPDPNTICGFVSCNYDRHCVQLICYNSNSGKTYPVCSYDATYWERWCE